MTTRTKVHATEQVTDEGQMAESAYGYNPIFQKRVTLGIDRTPGGGYHYYGPPPDVGTSYGSWFDDSNNIGAIAPVTADGVTLFSPLSGAEMKYEGPANADMRDAVLAYKGDFHLMPASSSGHACLTSADIYGGRACPAMFNPFTGEEITEEFQTMSTQKKSMKPATAASDGPAQNSFKVKKITVPKVGQDSIPYSKDGNSMKPASMSGVDSSKDGLNKATNPHGSDEPTKEKTVKQSSIKPAGEVKVPDVGMDSLPHAHGSAKKPVEAMSDDELVAALEAHLAKADDGSEAPKLSIEFEEGNEEAPPPPPPAPMPESGGEGMPPPPPPPPEEELPPASSGMPMMDPAAGPHEELGPDGQPMHSEEEAPCGMCGNVPCSCAESAGEPQIPVLDVGNDKMPMAHVQLVKKLRATAAALRAGVKVEKSEQNALMRQAVAVLKNGKAPTTARTVDESAMMQSIRDLTKTVSMLSEKIASMQKTTAASSSSEDSEKVEEIMEKKDSSEKAEGVHFEVLQSLDDIEKEGITASSITAQLFAEGGVNPFWNITVHGEPLARIYLQDQARPDEIKAVFCSPRYGEALAKASEQIEGGIRQVLTDANARFFTLQLDRSDVAKKAKDTATAEAKKIVAEKLSTLSDTFLECMATAAIGMDRNFFTGGNPLKHAFAETLTKYGHPVAQAVEIIESAFSDGSADYFKVLAKKASDLMAMEPVAFDQLRRSILDAGTVKPVVSTEPTSASVSTNVVSSNSMVQHLVEQSNAIAGVNMSVMGGEPLSEKEMLRRELGLQSTTISRR